ncbi:MAG: Fic family protein [Anaeromyxobacter sp.]
MSPRSTGRYEPSVAAGEAVNAFVPSPLPPRDPPIDVALLQERLRSAEHALARLDLAGEMVPSVDWLLYAFVRKEAVLSSQIEGTQASLVDLFSFEAEGGPPPTSDLEEVSNYLEALAFARAQLASPRGLPLSVRLLSEAHRRLMRGVRGGDKAPGSLRRIQNWVGGSRPSNAVFVPPPPNQVGELLAALERYLHQDDGLPGLVRAGLIHVQFETIHPYLDGNGRLGRLLIGLALEHWILLRRPLLYLSLFFKRNRPEYYRRLDAVRSNGDWEGWLDFFLDGVATIAEETVGTIRSLFTVVASDRERLLSSDEAGLAALRLFEQLPRHPVVTAATVQRLLETTKPTAGRAVEALVAAGILVETTGKQRDRSYTYQRYLDLLREGTDLNRPPSVAEPTYAEPVKRRRRR